MQARSTFGSRLAMFAGAMMMTAGLVGWAVPASAKSPSTPPPDCTSTSTGSSGTCTLYTPNGTYNANGTVDYTYNAGLGQLTLTFNSIASPSDGPWLCLGPNPMTSYLNDPANVCTPNGVLAKGSGQSRVLPSSGTFPTYVFAVPSGDYWFIHIVSGGNTLEATSPDATGSSVPTSGSVQVTKTDAKAAPLGGAFFALWTDVSGSPGAATGVTCGPTDSNGQCTMTGITPGTYFVKETQAPSGFTGSAPQLVTVTAGSSPATLTFVDTAVVVPPGDGTVTVDKMDATGAPLIGAGFTLFTDVGNAPGTSTSISCGISAIVSGTASCALDGIAPGTYFVVETGVPAGYSAGAPQKVTVDSNSQTITFVDTAITITGLTPPVISSPAASPSTTTTTQAVAGATTIHTGEPWAGSLPLVFGGLGLGAVLIGLGGLARNRSRRTPVAAGWRSRG